jgi:GTP cyclohydrolase IA
MQAELSCGRRALRAEAPLIWHRRAEAWKARGENSEPMKELIEIPTLAGASFEELAREMLIRLGEQPEREGLAKTPERYAQALHYLTKGYSEDPEQILKGALFSVDYDEMVIVKDIEMFSLCEHHVLPFFGKVHVAYIPKGKVIGLSKVPRLVEVFARRLQVQERLTVQIGETIQKIIQPLGVGVVIEARHLCMMMRGVEKQHSATVTSSMLGAFRAQQTRQEFLSLIRDENGNGI